MDVQPGIAIRRPRRGEAAGRTTRTMTAAAVAVTILVAGCGGGSSASSQVTSTIKSYLADIANGNGPAACNQLSTAAKQQLAGASASFGAKTCPQAVLDASKELKGDEKQTLLKAKVIDVHVNGDTATANLKGGTRAAHLTKIGGRWLISGGFT
jgi:hypothetical protein